MVHWVYLDLIKGYRVTIGGTMPLLKNIERPLCPWCPHVVSWVAMVSMVPWVPMVP